MKKLQILFMCILLLMLSSCKNDNLNTVNSNSEITKIIFWNTYNGKQAKLLDEIIEKYNYTVGIDKNIFIESVSQTNARVLIENLNKSANNEINSYEMPNMFMAYPDMLYQIDDKVELINIKDYMSQSELEKYRKEFLEDGEIIKNKLFVFPLVKSTDIMILNKTYFDEFAKKYDLTYDDLKTWESIIKVSELYYKYTDDMTPDILNDGKAFFNSDVMSNFFLISYNQLGDEFIRKNGDLVELNFDKEILKKIFNTYYDSYIKGYFYKNSKHSTDDAKILDILAFTASSTSVSYFNPTVYDNGEMKNIDVKVLPVPHFENSQPSYIRQGSGICVIKQDKNNENKEIACLDFLKWFTNNKNNLEFATSLSYMPVKNNFFECDDVKSFLSKENLNMTKFELEAMQVSSESIKTNSKYFLMNFKNATELRNYLGTSLRKIANENKKAMDLDIKNGMSRENAILKYTKEDIFENWYNDFVFKANSILEK